MDWWKFFEKVQNIFLKHSTKNSSENSLLLPRNRKKKTKMFHSVMTAISYDSNEL